MVLFTKVDFFVDKINEGAFNFKKFKGNKYSTIETFEFILNLFKGIYKESSSLQYHVVNLLDSKETFECIDCILRETGPFISPLLSLSHNNISFKNKLFTSLINRNESI
ncbi:hypothetical protein ABK040_006608 [Willaertia magna]